MKTLDFIYALVIILGTSALMAVLTITLTFTEVLQYIAFSGSRAYFAADLDYVSATSSDQASAAEAKVTALTKSLPFFNSALQNGWIVINTRAANNYSGYRDSIGANPLRNQFVGYQLQFSAPILSDIKIPLLGNVLTPPNGNSFSATVSSFLLREPSFKECQTYLNGLYKAVIRLNSKYQQAMSSTGVTVTPDTFEAVLDNGC